MKIIEWSVLLAGFLLIGPGLQTAAGGDADECRPLTSPVTGEQRKYSAVADIDGASAYPDIVCAVYWRNNELCATELSSFQFTAKVFDYHSGDEVPMTDAHYVVAAPGHQHPLAFVSRDEAAEFRDRVGGGELLDYQELVAYPFD